MSNRIIAFVISFLMVFSSGPSSIIQAAVAQEQGTNPEAQVVMDEEDITYTYTFYDADDTVIDTVEVPQGEKLLNLPNEPTLEGFVFKHWYEVDDQLKGDETQKAKFDDAANADKIFKPYFEKVQDIDQDKTTNKEKSETIKKQDKPLKPQNESINNNSRDFGLFSIIQPVVPRHVYTFVDRDGNEVETQIIKNGETLLEPEAKEIPGYKFDGWYIDGDAEKPVTFGEPIEISTNPDDPDKEFTVKAKYKDITYVYFMLNDIDDDIKNYSVIETKSVVTGETVDDSSIPTVVTRSGKAAGHWSLDPIDGEPFDFTTEINEPTTLYLILVDRYNVVFDSQGGTYIPMQPVVKGSDATEPENPPKRAGYRFSHWSATEDGEPYTFEDNPVDGELKLYAVWIPQDVEYTVAYWLENPNDDLYTLFDEIVEKTGKTGSKATYDPKTFEGFRLNTDMTNEASTSISGDGSTVRNVYYSRNVHTFTMKVKNNSVWEEVASGDFKFGQTTYDVYETTRDEYPQYMWYLNPEKVTGDPAYTEAPTMPNRDVITYGRPTKSVLYITKYVEKATGKEIKDRFWFYGSGTLYYTKEDGIDIKGFTVLPVSEWQGFPKQGDPQYGTIFYKRNSYDIIFHSKYDANPEAEDPTKTVTKTISKIPYEEDISDKVLADYKVGETQVKDGLTYTFAGWYDNAAFIGDPIDFTDKQMPAKNLILYAKWLPPQHKVYYHTARHQASPVELDEDGTPKMEVVSHGDVPKMLGTTSNPPDNIETNEWGGWYWYVGGEYDPEIGNYVGGKFVPYNGSAIMQETHLYPVWKYPYLSVTYDLNGGRIEANDPYWQDDYELGEPDSEGYVYSFKDGTRYLFGTETRVLPAKKLIAPPGKAFLGWKKIGGKEDGTIFYYGDSGPIDGNVLLEAQWGPQPKNTKLTYKANGGAGDDVLQELSNNEQVQAIDNPFTREGYRFIGWGVDAETHFSNIIRPGEAVLVDHEDENNANTLYAQWEELIDVKATKGWIGIDPEDEKPDIWFSLYRSVEGGTAEKVGKPNTDTPHTKKVEGDTVTWTGLEKTNSDGKDYTYWVKETDSEGIDWVPASFEKVEDGLHVTNSYKSVDITAVKQWSDNSPEEKPEVKFQLQRKIGEDGTYEPVGKPVTLNGGDWTATWLNQPQEAEHGVNYIYNVIEIDTPASYEVSYSKDTENENTFIVTNTFQSKDFTVEKKWDYPNDVGRPAEGDLYPPVTLQLYQDGDAFGEPVKIEASANPEDYKYTWKNIPKYKSDGVEHEYHAVETEVPNNYQKIWDNNGHTITNIYTPGTMTGQKEWIGKRPSENTTVDLQLYQRVVGQTEYVEFGDPVTVNKDDLWQYQWKDLPVSDVNGSGQQITYEYKVEEKNSPDGYWLDEHASNLNPAKVVNVSKYTDFTVTKNWENGSASERPDVEVYLVRKTDNAEDAEFEKVEDSTVVLKAGESLTHTWENLEAYAQWDSTDPTKRVRYIYMKLVKLCPKTIMRVTFIKIIKQK